MYLNKLKEKKIAIKRTTYLVNHTVDLYIIYDIRLYSLYSKYIICIIYDVVFIFENFIKYYNVKILITIVYYE